MRTRQKTRSAWQPIPPDRWAEASDTEVVASALYPGITSDEILTRFIQGFPNPMPIDSAMPLSLQAEFASGIAINGSTAAAFASMNLEGEPDTQPSCDSMARTVVAYGTEECKRQADRLRALYLELNS